MGLILLIVLILLLIGALPRWGYNSDWGYRPSGILTIILLVFLVLWLTNNLPSNLRI